MDNKLITLKNKAEQFNLSLTDKVLNRFGAFEEILKDYNSHTNLVSAKDINLIYEKHFVDSLSFGKFIKQDSNIKLIDIGSGGGFPIIPIAIILNNSKIFAVDSTNKKVSFLNNTAQELGLKNFTAINTRAEQLAFDGNFREQFDIVTARAVGNLGLISELCIPFLKVGGKFIAYKSAKVEEEIENAKSAIEILGGEIKEIYEYNLELDENFQRNLVVIEKIKETPKDYPRKYSTIKYKQL